MCIPFWNYFQHIAALAKDFMSNDFLQVALRYTPLLLGVMNPLLISQLLSNTLYSTQYPSFMDISKRYPKNGIKVQYSIHKVL